MTEKIKHERKFPLSPFIFVQCELTLILCSLSLFHPEGTQTLSTGIYHLCPAYNVNPTTRRRFFFEVLMLLWIHNYVKTFDYNMVSLTTISVFCICCTWDQMYLARIMKIAFAFHHCEPTLSLSLYLDLCHLVVSLYRNSLTLE